MEDVVAVETAEILARRQPRAEVPRRSRAASFTECDPRAVAPQTSDDLTRVHIDRRIVDDDDFGGRTRLLLDAVDGFEQHLPEIAARDDRDNPRAHDRPLFATRPDHRSQRP